MAISDATHPSIGTPKNRNKPTNTNVGEVGVSTVGNVVVKPTNASVNPIKDADKAETNLSTNEKTVPIIPGMY